MDSSGDLFASGSSSFSNTPVEFSGVSGCSSVSTSTTVTQSPLIQEDSAEDPDDPVLVVERPTYKCSICLKVLKTAHGFKSHSILHKVKAAHDNRPSYDDLMGDILLLAELVLQDMVKEPNLTEESAEKKECVETLLSALESPNWNHFLNAATEPLLDIVLERTKVLPSNNYEQNIKKVNVLLSKEGFMNLLKDMLSVVCCSASSASYKPTIIERVLYRFLDRFFRKLSVLVVSKMRSTTCSSSCSSSSVISEKEKLAFFSKMSSIVIDFVKKNHTSAVNENYFFSLALREKFVDSVEEGISLREFLDAKSWEYNDSGSPKLQLSDRAQKFFLCLEILIRTKAEKTVNFESLFEPNNEHILELWNSLTASRLGEDKSLLILEKFFAIVHATSMKAEAEKQLRVKELETRLQKHAHRTGLKRN